MKNQVETFIDLIQSSGHTLSELGFSKGAPEKNILSLEKKIGQKIPDAFKLFLSYINGQETEDFYFLPDQVRLFSCKEIMKEWELGEEQSEDGEESYNEFHCEDKIRWMMHHESRIPFAGQEGFGIVYIDNDPGPKGKIGQIIYLVDECDFVVLADSFAEFIDLYIDRMQRGILKFEKEKEGYANKFRLKSKAKNMDGYEFVKIFN